MKKLVQIVTSLVFLSGNLFVNNAWAQSTTQYFEIKEPPSASEYIYRSSPKESLIAVQLLGAVKKPGIYYIPQNTDVLKLLALAGGTDQADLSEVLVRKTDPTQVGVFELDIEKLMKSTSGVKPFKLMQDDFVFVPKQESWISNDVTKTITIASLIATIVLTGVLIDKNSN